MRYFTKNHLWLIIDKQEVTIGISNFGQDDIGLLNYLSLVKQGAKLTLGDSFAQVESNKSTSELIIPISGTIIDVNQEVLKEPQMINKNWQIPLLKLSLDEQIVLDDLMLEDQYLKYLETLV